MNELENSRKTIDAIDKQIAELFEQRMEAVGVIAKYKKEHSLPVYDKTRENSILDKNLLLIKNETYREYYHKFMQDLMSVSRMYQTRLTEGLKVIYSGTEGAFGYIASKKLFPNASLTACDDFESAYRAVENGEYDCTILPIENSYAGDVGAVMDLMFSGSLYVNQIIELDVVHNLIAKKGATLDKIKTVVSHPQALEQCEDYIKAHGLKTASYSNTALAAKYVLEQCDDSFAAIASAETAEIFGMDILDRSINTARNNTTRFAVLTRAQHIPSPSSQNENEHFILVFTAKNEAGSLAQALNIIGAHNYNMRNLRSRPMKELLWNYYFFIEAEGNIGTSNGQQMLRELSAVCARVKLVGTYN
ncbi:MAG: chorismate mutase [Christensenellaceae bacterium]